MAIERADVGTFCYTECGADLVAKLFSEYKSRTDSGSECKSEFEQEAEF